jgi:glycosyltransferase involved in cell wall biosynthesis
MLSRAKNTLFVFTNEYPYGTGESFIENELIVLSEKFNTIFIFPLYNGGQKRAFPNDKIQLVDLFDNKIKSNRGVFFKNSFHLFSILLREFIASENKKYFLSAIRRLNSILLKNFAREELLASYIKQSAPLSSLYYSFWTDDWATILSISKEKGHIGNFFSRVHGYDLYAERWPGKITPFRHFQINNVSAIYAVSKDGQHYLQTHYSDHHAKFRLSHLSTFDNGTGYFNPDGIFTIVSCSRLDKLKRVHLIAESLKSITFPMKWVHFGDGKEMSIIKELCASLPENIKVELKGNVSNKMILDFYKSTSVNLFISISETEGGVPLSLQEAASFGIPLLGTSTGGVVEIVNEKTGVLLPVNFQMEDLVSVIKNFKGADKNTISFRSGVREFWKHSFNALTNYTNFYESIINN